jgi:hypothetical protein
MAEARPGASRFWWLGFRLVRTFRARTRFLWATGNRACLSVALMTLTGASVASFSFGPPAGRSHDEASYLLAADTFAHGRIANPTHPKWEHFESFHILQQPTYASKYPPAQGLFLALGQVLFGFPIVGAWSSLAAAAAAVCWMLRGWFSPGWAFLGTLLLVSRPQMLIGWGDSYWGGSVAVLGGALVLGATARLLRTTRAPEALTLAAGLLLLANSRPYEGAVYSVVPVGLILVRALRAPREGNGAGALLSLVPAGLLLALGFALMAYYNHRVTGHALKLPYVAYEEQYSYVPVFGLGGAPPERDRSYRHDVFRSYYETWGEWTYHATSLSPERWRFRAQLVEDQVRRFYLGFALLPPLALSLLRLRGVAILAWSTCGLVLGANLASAWIWPHYFAPAAGALYLAITLGLRRCSACRLRGRPIGASLLILLIVAAAAESARSYPALVQHARNVRLGWPGVRADLERLLAKRPRRSLVIVRYGPGHNPHDEWVYNRADIDGSPVVWAREMDAASNRELLQYFAAREAWLVQPDQSPVLISGYPTPAREEPDTGELSSLGQ